MTEAELLANGYFAMDSPIQGRIYTKQNGNVVYYAKNDKLQLPNGNVISNPIYSDFTADYSAQTIFSGANGGTCIPCSKK